MRPHLLEFSAKSTLSSGMFQVIGAMRSAGDLFKKEPTVSSLFWILHLPKEKTSWHSSRKHSCKEPVCKTNPCSCMLTTIDKDRTDRPSRLLRQVFPDHLSRLTSKWARLRTLLSFLEALSASTPDASGKWRNSRGVRSNKWWSDEDRWHVTHWYTYWYDDASS